MVLVVPKVRSFNSALGLSLFLAHTLSAGSGREQQKTHLGVVKALGRFFGKE